MKRLATTVTIIATLAASSAALANPSWSRGHGYGHGHRGFYTHARVVSVRPIIRPAYASRRICRAYPVGERARVDARRSAGTLLGAIIGGALGNTIGKGDGRAAATVAGAVIGGAIGSRTAQAADRDGRVHLHARPVYQRRCAIRTVQVRRQVGYAVTYRYRGSRFHARMDHDPGRRVRVHVGRRVRVAE